MAPEVRPEEQVLLVAPEVLVALAPTVVLGQLPVREPLVDSGQAPELERRAEQESVQEQAPLEALALLVAPERGVVQE
jgi:hypothetical protein